MTTGRYANQERCHRFRARKPTQVPMKRNARVTMGIDEMKTINVNTFTAALAFALADQLLEDKDLLWTE